MGVEYRKPGTVTMIPHASTPVKKFGDLSFEEIKALSPDLSEEEKASPHAKFYYEPNVLSPEYQAIVDGPPMDVADAFEPEEYGKHMNIDGYCKVENGYCVLPSGIPYSAVLIKQPGRNNERMDAYNKEFGTVGALAYKCWTPGAHYFHYTDGAIEDFGYGLLNMHTYVESDGSNYCNGTDITKLGVDIEHVTENDPRCIWIGGNDWDHFQVLEDHIAEKPFINLIVNYLRETDEGRELRIRMFTGVGIRNGKLVKSDLPVGVEPLELARLHMIHLMLEYGHESRLVNQYWELRNKQ